MTKFNEKRKKKEKKEKKRSFLAKKYSKTLQQG